MSPYFGNIESLTRSSFEKCQLEHLAFYLIELCLVKYEASLSQERMRPGLSIEIASWLSSCSLNTKGIFTRKVVAKREKSFVHSPKSTSFLSHVLDGQHAFVFFCKQHLRRKELGFLKCGPHTVSSYPH